MYKWRSSIRARFEKAIVNHYDLLPAVVEPVLANDKLLHPKLLDSLAKVAPLQQDVVAKLLVAHCVEPSAQPDIPEQLGKVPTNPHSSLPLVMSCLLACTTTNNDTGRLTADKLLELV